MNSAGNGSSLAALSRSQLLRGIQIACFALKEAQLFLDTHPKDKDALAYYQRYHSKKQQLSDEYSRRFGPLSLSDYDAAEETWQWVQGPWPWEWEE